MYLFLAVTSLCLASASAAVLEDPLSIFKFQNDSKEEEIQDYTEMVLESDFTQQFTTTSSDLPNVNSCVYPGTCPSLSDATNCQRCQIGFVNDPEDHTKCKYADQDVNAFLLTAISDTVKLISLDTKISTSILPKNKFAYSHGVDYNFQTNQIFWFSNKDEAIYTAPLLNYVHSEKKSITHDNSSIINGLTVDWIYNHLYWVNGRNDFVVSNFNGTIKKVLLNDGYLPAVTIVVNPLSGWMHWTDSNTHQIKRAGLDGSQREVIHATDIYFPRGLILDLVENRLYWSQIHSFHSIWSSNFDGSDRKLVFTANSHSTLRDVRQMTLFDKYIYLMDWGADVIYKVNKCNGQDFKRIYNSTTILWDLKMYHSTIQPEGENLCSKRFHPCSHICLPAPSSGRDGFVSRTTCACPTGLYLSSDQRSCVSELSI